MISIIVAIDEKNGIGKNGKIPWHITSDFKRLKKITQGHPIIMGRKTYESIGKPLPERTNIIISRNPAMYHQLVNDSDNFVACNSLQESINIANKSDGNEEIFIFGGGQIFEEAMKKDLVDRLYLTIIKGDYKADTFFPEYKEFRIISEESGSEGKYKFKYVTLEKS